PPTSTSSRQTPSRSPGNTPPPSPSTPTASASPATATRRLRIGYYSPDFRRHSIAHFFLPLLRHHDRATFEIFLYSDTRGTDATTATLRELADHWRDLAPLPEPDAIRLLAADRLDLLIDLAGLFGATRPRLFAARPAPVQAHLLGYHGSTGLTSLDYRFTDAVCDPPGAEANSSEKLVRLPHGFHCFDPLVPPLPEGTPPCLAAGHFTFGSCNALPKLNPDVVALWARVLHAVPASCLLLKAIQLHDPELRAEVVARFAAHGLDPARIEALPGTSSLQDHLATYRRIDLALDPFPCNGTTTTCEALWMGVPVLTLPGARHSARVTSSLLAQVGLPEFIATSADDYVHRAATLAAAPDRLAHLRSTLRARLAASPLGDVRAYARRLEAAYQEIIARPE
ncbi:MAG: glycosyltransferase, partial [Burkholderiales bacterium]|nr:glycosyltransferase [Opitutaceae bacterium]